MYGAGTVWGMRVYGILSMHELYEVCGLWSLWLYLVIFVAMFAWACAYYFAPQQAIVEDDITKCFSTEGNELSLFAWFLDSVLQLWTHICKNTYVI